MARCAGSPRQNRMGSSRSPPAVPNSCRARSSKTCPPGAAALAEFAYVAASKYPINVALHTDHCQPEKVDAYIRPLLAMSAQRQGGPFFQSHMLDASTLPLEENLAMAKDLLDECTRVGSHPGARNRRGRRQGRCHGP